MSLSQKTYIVGIGAQKAGTSWLHHQLWHHPQVAMSGMKELHFFDSRHGAPEMRWDEETFRTRFAAAARNVVAQPELLRDPVFRADLDGLYFRMRTQDEPNMYRRYFRHLIHGSHRVFGEITPAYSTLPLEGFRAIRGFHPQVKVIYLLRDPVSRLWSAFRQLCRRREETPGLETFERYLDKAQPRARSDYGATLSKLETVFEPGEIWIGFYETLFRTESVDSLADFLGIDRWAAHFELQVNASPDRSEEIPEELRRLALRYTAASYRACVDRFADSIPEGWDRRGVDTAGRDEQGLAAQSLPTVWIDRYRRGLGPFGRPH
ncbi:hypothetical protein ABI59_19275 [Acidobacteria bacterium Mor1]|nr:hypothetical protein ABI59_19275 [Acidobacteria bacterium Mor1]